MIKIIKFTPEEDKKLAELHKSRIKEILEYIKRKNKKKAKVK